MGAYLDLPSTAFDRTHVFSKISPNTYWLWSSPTLYIRPYICHSDQQSGRCCPAFPARLSSSQTDQERLERPDNIAEFTNTVSKPRAVQPLSISLPLSTSGSQYSYETDVLPSSSYPQIHEKSLDSTATSMTSPPANMSRSSILSFRDLSYQVKNKQDHVLLVDDVSLDIKAGELLAIMGPSGAGKSTLLDLMSFRKQPMSGSSVYYNGKRLEKSDMQDLSMFVEQEDALIGVLTVRESVTLSLKLHNPNLPKKEVNARVQRVLSVMGLLSCAEQRIGTPISRGISGGQKRRVTAACAMVTYPKIFFLDEVTSGLDSMTAREVMTAIRNLAIAEGMIVLVTIHQPSFDVLSQFTDVLLLAKGKTSFYGKVTEMEAFFDTWGHPVPKFVSPTEHAMNFLNDDFSLSRRGIESKPGGPSMREFFLSRNPRQPDPEIFEIAAVRHESQRFHAPQTLDIALKRTLVLSKRSMINYSRNLLAYGVRAGMYAGMGLMVATIWIRLGMSDAKINDRLSVYFYSVAFLSFMSVAGIPSFLEERAVFYREKKNGMCTTLPFVLSNTIVSLPFLFLCTILFMVIFYWGVGLHPGAAAFFRFFAFLYLSIIAAEGQVVLVSSIVPVFVAALAVSAFTNGFLMSVGGFLVRSRSLPRFWFFSFHYMDYQKYAFELITHSDLAGLTFTCNSNVVNGTCFCAYPSSTPQDCTVSGKDVLNYLKIDTISYAKWTGILISITVIYRIALYFILRLSSR